MKHINKMVQSFAALGGFLILAAGSAEDSGSSRSSSSPPSPSEAVSPDADETVAAPPPPAAPDPEFVTLRKEHCEKYKAASNDIKKSAVFEEYFTKAAAAGHKVEGLAGTVDTIETPQGGAEVWVEFKTDYGSFRNNDSDWKSPREIKKGTPLYNSIGALDEGTKVTFSGSLVIGAKNLFDEKMGVCGDGWLVKITKVDVAE
jgi:hypothetical protein